jgi:hypothetical protein
MWTTWSLSRLAAETVDVEGAAARAEAAGLMDATLEYCYYDAQQWCRIACQRPVAEFLFRELKTAVLAASTAEARAECAAGLNALLLAMALPELSCASPLPRGGRDG